MKYVIFLILTVSLYAQSNITAPADSAYANAKKGIYWAFSNIPESKKSDSHDIIVNDNLLAEVKIYREIEGVKTEVTGWFETTKVTITTYKSFATLKNEGFIKENKSFLD